MATGAERGRRPGAEVDEPVGHVDLVPTFCEIAGAAVPDWAQGRALPTRPGIGPPMGHHRVGQPVPPHRHASALDLPRRVALHRLRAGTPLRGTEGELYELAEDPLQWRNLWDDPAYRARRDELVTDLYDNLPPERETKLAVEAPV